MGRPRVYPDELRERAVRLVREWREARGVSDGGFTAVCKQLGLHRETLRSWVIEAEVEAGSRPGVPRDDRDRIAELERENRELRRANEILKSGRGFLRGGARPPTEEVVAFIDAHRDAVRGRADLPGARRSPRPPTTRPSPGRRAAGQVARRGAEGARSAGCIEEQLGVYGARKVWRQLHREGIAVGRCTGGPPDGRAGPGRAASGAGARTTTSRRAVADRPADLVDRGFTASAPNQLWVADLTYVATWSGFAYAAFVIDVFSRRIVGWRVADHPARRPRPRRPRDGHLGPRNERLDGLVHHSDRGVQYLSIRYTERLADGGAVTSVGSRGDSYDNALAETVNGLYKARADHHARPVADRRRGRAGHPGLGPLVEHQPPPLAPSATSRRPSTRPPTTLNNN